MISENAEQLLVPNDTTTIPTGQQQQPGSSYFKESINEIMLGSISGAIGKLVEYPFDTIKVRLQYSQAMDKPIFDNALDCIKKTYHHEGISTGFYKGVSSPLVGAAMEYSSLFWSYDLAKIAIRGLGLGHGPGSGQGAGIDLDLKYKILAGGISGAVTSFILTPVELIKCQMQINNLDQGTTKSITEMIKQIYNGHNNNNNNKGLINFWKGQSSTFLRETGGTMFWFGTYEYCLIKFKEHNQSTIPSSVQLLVSGAAAGITYNLSFFPIDTIKSVMQTSQPHGHGQGHGQRQSYIQIAKLIYSKGGLTKFYTGCGITVARAIPSNAIVFYLYETMKLHWLN